MNDDASKPNLQAEIRNGLLQAIQELGLTTGKDEGPSEVELEEYQFAGYENSHENSIEISSEISGWFPPNTIQGRLAYESYKRIMDDNPEPSGNILNPPKIDMFLRDIISRDSIKRDEALTALQVDTARGLRPIISLATMLDRTELAYKKCKQAIYLGINTMAKISSQRKTTILRALRMSEAEIEFWCGEIPDTREWLFGTKLKDALESKQQRQYQRSISRIVTDRARGQPYNAPLPQSPPLPPSSSSSPSSFNPPRNNHNQPRRGDYRPRGRGRAPNYHQQSGGSRQSSSSTSNC